MLGQRKLTKKRAGDAKDLALQLARDPRFRKQLLSAVKHSDAVRGRTRRALGLGGALRRLATDETLRTELRSARDDLRRAYGRLEKKNRSHKLRNVTLVAALASLAAAPRLRKRLTPGSRTHSLDDLTKEELYERAQRADIPGRSDMTKDELVAALRGSS